MTNLEALQTILIVVICVSVVRMLAQGIFFYGKFNQTFPQSIIPGYSSYCFHDAFGMRSWYIIGSIFRVVGFLLCVGILLWQYYDSMLQMTHMYGLMFHTYEHPDYNTIWTMFSYGGVFLMLAGVILRWFSTRYISQFFCMKGFVNVLGTIEPTLYYLWMTASSKCIFVMNKKRKNMSNNEYQLYCLLSENIDK